MFKILKGELTRKETFSERSVLGTCTLVIGKPCFYPNSETNEGKSNES
jgi:hypothetical protein